MIHYIRAVHADGASEALKLRANLMGCWGHIWTAVSPSSPSHLHAHMSHCNCNCFAAGPSSCLSESPTGCGGEDNPEFWLWLACLLS